MKKDYKKTENITFLKKFTNSGDNCLFTAGALSIKSINMRNINSPSE